MPTGNGTFAAIDRWLRATVATFSLSFEHRLTDHFEVEEKAVLLRPAVPHLENARIRAAHWKPMQTGAAAAPPLNSVSPVFLPKAEQAPEVTTFGHRRGLLGNCTPSKPQFTHGHARVRQLGAW